MKALTLVSLIIDKKTYNASTDDEPVVVDLSEKEFDRLEAMNAVRKPTAKELKLAQIEDAEVVQDAPAKKSAAPKSGKQAATPTEGGGTDDKQPAGGADPSLDL